MFDKEAIQELTKAEAITAAAHALFAAVDPAAGPSNRVAVAALPEEFKVRDLEAYLPLRRRARGTMTTGAIVDFAAYVTDQRQEGATVFVDADLMQAVAVLNLGTPGAPGHADNRAKLVMQRTAAYKALFGVTRAEGHTQATVAEWLEDWRDCIVCSNSGGEIPSAQAIAAVRKITIEALRRVESEQQQLGTSHSAMESIKAKDTDTLPTAIMFRCEPYLGLAARTFALRLGILTTEKPKIVLRIAAVERHAEEMAAELSALVDKELASAMVPCLVGSYAVGA